MALGGILLCITGLYAYLMVNISSMPIFFFVKRFYVYSHGFCCTFTGSEAMFADLGHFSQLSIKVCCFKFVYIWYRISGSTSIVKVTKTRV